jgi:hypothetical protein
MLAAQGLTSPTRAHLAQSSCRGQRLGPDNGAAPGEHDRLRRGINCPGEEGGTVHHLNHAGEDTEASVDAIGQLLSDWSDLCERSDVPRILRRWAQQEPALAGLGSLPAILDVLHVGGADYDHRDAILLALLRIAQQRSGRHNAPTPDASVAGRVLLQTMAPAALRIASSGARFIGADYDDVQDIGDRAAATMAALWETILNYNLDRPAAGHKVASNLKLGTLNRLTRGGIWRTHNLRANREVVLDYDETAPAGVWSALDRPSAEDSVTYGEDVLPDPTEATVDTLLAWAAHHHVLSDDDLQVLQLAYRQGLDHHTGAERLGVTPAAFRKRASRAVQRLRAGYCRADVQNSLCAERAGTTGGR